MSKAAVAACDHDTALLIEDADLHTDFRGQTFFFCAGCGVTLSDEGADVGFDPTKPMTKASAPHRPKAPAPLPKRKGGAPGRNWSKNQTGKVMVTCQWAKCSNQFLAWRNSPEKLEGYCPQLHRGMHKWLLQRERQKRWREKQKQARRSKTSTMSKS